MARTSRAGRVKGGGFAPGVNGSGPAPSAEAPPMSQWLTADRATPAALEWIIPGLIPWDRLTLVVGESGVGKSTLYASLIATHTRGSAWLSKQGGERRAPGRAILYTPEGADDATTIGRLRAAGADLSRVALGDLTGQRTPTHRLELPDGLAGASCRWSASGISLVVLDPLASYLGPGVSPMESAAVRSVLEPLAYHAEHYGVTVLATAHYRKGREGGPLDWVAGAAAWTQVPRHVVALGVDPERPSRRVIASAKQSGYRELASYTYVINDVAGAGQFAITGSCNTSPEALGRAVEGDAERDALADARELLREGLADEDCRVKLLVTRAREEGISERTLRRAKVALGVTSKHAGSAGDRHRVWCRPEKWPD